jgi:uncharacterized RDD family membrane protein YckC
MQTEQTLDDFLSVENDYVRASTGQRFANYLIDLVLFYVLLFLIGIFWAFSSPESVEAIAADDSAGFNLLDRLLSLVLYALYMSAVEAIFKGKSLGKLITGTRAVNLDGTRISVSTAFARGFSRAVPFCAFSAFGNPCDPWQDRWTNTMVVIDKKQ